jgi:O-antigen ligase
MSKPSPAPPYLVWCLFAFAVTAVASIALQNFIWVAVALFLFFQFTHHRRFDWPRGHLPTATLLFLATFFISALLGTDPGNSFHTVHKYLTFSLLFFIAAMPLVLRQIEKLLLALTYGAAFCALHGIWNHFMKGEERITSFSGDKMVFGGMLMVSLLLQFYFLKKEPKKPFHWISLVLISIGLLFTETRGAWLGFLIGFFFLLWAFRRKWILPFALTFLAGFFLLPERYQDRVRAIWGPNRPDASNDRLYMWQSGGRISRDYPLGVGQGNIGKVYPPYKLPQAVETRIPHLHNNFMQILVQNGWLGLAAYLFWIFSYYWMALRFKPRDPVAGEWNWALLCVFTAVLVWGLTEYTFSHQFMNFQFFLLGLQVNFWKFAAPSRPNRASKK